MSYTKTTSRWPAISNVSSDTQNMVGSLVFLQEIWRAWEVGGETGERLFQSMLCLNLPRKHCRFPPVTSCWQKTLGKSTSFQSLKKEHAPPHPLFLNPQINLGISIAHTDFDPEARAHSRPKLPCSPFLFLSRFLFSSAQKGFLLLSVRCKSCSWMIINSHTSYSWKMKELWVH